MNGLYFWKLLQKYMFFSVEVGKSLHLEMSISFLGGNIQYRGFSMFTFKLHVDFWDSSVYFFFIVYVSSPRKNVNATFAMVVSN